MADVVLDMAPWQSLNLIPKSVFNSWAEHYRKFAFDRFHRFTRGGGNWQRLKQSTVDRKARRGSVRTPESILIETGALIVAIRPNARASEGGFKRLIKNGVRVGYGGSAKHPSGRFSPFKKDLKIVDVARFHQRGAGRLPRREIIVPPPKTVLDAMAQDVVRHWNSLGR